MGQTITRMLNFTVETPSLASAPRDSLQEERTQRGPNGAGYNTTAFFGTHFLMGGERYDAAKADGYLFGDTSDLELLGNKPAKVG